MAKVVRASPQPPACSARWRTSLLRMSPIRGFQFGSEALLPLHFRNGTVQAKHYEIASSRPTRLNLVGPSAESPVFAGFHYLFTPFRDRETRVLYLAHGSV